MNITLRPATADDCSGILATHVASIRELCAADYSEAQLQDWTANLTSEAYLPAIASHVVVVAERDAEIVGFAELDPKGEDMVEVYVHPRHSRLGLGSLLLQAVERSARDAGLDELVLISSLTAVPFYERFGFVAGPATVRRHENGTEIPSISMRKSF
jgi:putative acetyltransferase